MIDLIIIFTLTLITLWQKCSLSFQAKAMPHLKIVNNDPYLRALQEKSRRFSVKKDHLFGQNECRFGHFEKKADRSNG